MILHNRLIYMYLAIWVCSLILVYFRQNWNYLLLPYIIFLVNELFYLFNGRDMLDSKNRTKMFYDLARVPINYTTYQNYSGGYYIDDNFDITPEEAENNKFGKILDLLEAVEGDTILDLGCGWWNFCLFSKYCKEKNINVISLTLSPEQVKLCNSYGCEAYVWDVNKFNKNFEHKIDHIVILGSTEHVYTGPCNKEQSYKNKKQYMTKLLDTCKKYFKQDDKSHRIFYSGLHLNPNNITSFGNYVIERSFGGTLQINSQNLDIKASASDANYKIIYEKDATKDYYMATVLNEQHFGAPTSFVSNTSIGLLILSSIYPPAILIWIYANLGFWMWMYDGRIHTQKNKNYSLESEEKRPCTLKWCVFELQ